MIPHHAKKRTELQEEGWGFRRYEFFENLRRLLVGRVDPREGILKMGQFQRVNLGTVP